MDWLLILGIALANNLDNTGVGIAYGLGRIRLDVSVNLWISLITFAITASSVASGTAISHYLSPQIAKYVSATILCSIGVYMLFPFLRPRKKEPSGIHSILDDPLKADVDNSRHVDYKEGAVLGMVLSINNVGGGLSAGLLHLSITWTAALSAVFSFLALWLGGALGRRLATGRISQYATVFSGALLIIIGLFQLR